MKFLANENIPRASVNALRDAGHDVFDISSEAPGITDKEVLTIACAQERIIVTFDRDYGELIYRQGLASPLAVLYLRLAPSSPLEAAHVLFDLFRQETEIAGYFIAIERDSFRRKLLPKML